MSDGPLAAGIIALVCVVTAIVVGAVFAIKYSINVGQRKGDAEQEITRLCAARGGGIFYDVQGENKMVFACNDDGKLIVRAY